MIQVSSEDGSFPYCLWTAPYRTPAGRDAMLAAHGERFDLLAGRRTYDNWSGYWPKAPSSPMADRVNAATNGAPPRSLELVSTNAMPSGVVVSAYKVVGPLKAG